MDEKLTGISRINNACGKKKIVKYFTKSFPEANRVDPAFSTHDDLSIHCYGQPRGNLISAFQFPA